MNLADRVRGVVGPRPASGAYPAGSPGDPGRPESQPRADAVADTLGGEWRDGARGHRYLVVDTRYPSGHRHGRVAIEDCLPDEDGLWPGLWLLGSAVGPGRLLFVDLETTGLAGGAGTQAFLVGCGWFEGTEFRVRQFFLASYAAERTLLEAVAVAATAACGVVTYNGKTFDLPLIETRFLFHRLEMPFAGLPHVDMLHPARHLWRPEGEEAAASCRLTRVEEALLGHVRAGDVPGFEIPSRYFHYVRTNDARALPAVLEHNRLDLLALAMLTARAARLLDAGPAAARTPREAFGLGRLYEGAGLFAEARAAYATAAGVDAVAGEPLRVRPRDDDSVTGAEALRAYAVLCRRDRDYERAAAAWRRVIELRRCPARIAREATEALAVHHEHRAFDLEAARRFALQALQFNVGVSRTDAVRHRLARLDRKLGASPGLLG